MYVVEGRTGAEIADFFGVPRPTIAPQTLVAARRASDYLKTRRTPDGGVLVGHSTWSGDPQPDSQGKAAVATGKPAVAAGHGRGAAPRSRCAHPRLARRRLTGHRHPAG